MEDSESRSVSPAASGDSAFEPVPETACRDVLQNAPISIVLVAEKGEIVEVNAEFERLFGYTRAEIIGQSMEILLPERYRHGHVGQRDLFNKKPEHRPMGSRRDLTALKRDGTEFPVEIGLSPIPTDGSRGLLATAMIADLTERKRVERALTEHEETFRLLDENSPDLITLLDPAGKITFISRAITPICGYEPEELKDRHFSILLSPEHILEAGKHVQMVMEGEKLESFEFPVRRKDGTEAPLEFNAAPFVLAGVTQGILAVGRDISERKRAEEKLREIDRLKSAMVATVAHELRTPLAVIAMSLEMALNKTPEEAVSGLRASLEMAQRNVNRVGRLIENLLNLALIEEGRLSLARRRVDLGALVDEAMHSLVPLYEKRGIRLILESPPEAIEAEVDVDRITDVLTNLYGNAMRFARGEVTTRLAVSDGTARIVVEDDGPGVPVEKIDRIFDRFTRIPEHGGKSGTGLGLSISKGIVEAHGGELRAELRPASEESGMRFTVILPL